MTDFNKLLTIVTPTFNRAEHLKMCFQSLVQQTNHIFEWIIVDDGSTDDTRNVVTSFQIEQPQMHIQYVYKDNGGKHTALNASHSYIHGDYVLVLDSDDRLIPTAVDDIYSAWLKYDNEDIGIVIFLEGYSEDEPFSRGKKEGTPVDMYGVHTEFIISTDCCDIYKAEPFKKCSYPVFGEERFLSESVLWNQMADKYKIVYINKVIYLADYNEDGLTKAGRAMRIRVPQGGMYAANLFLDKKYDLKRRIKNAMLYSCYGFFAGKSLKEMNENCRNLLLMWLFLPAGWILYQYWGKKYR